MSVKGSGELYSDIATVINDNNTGDITPSDVRGVLQDGIDSRYVVDIHNYGDQSGTVNIDLQRPAAKMNLTGNLTSANTLNRSADLSKTVRVWISGDSSYRAVSLNDNWQWLGVRPSGLDINAIGFLTLQSFGPQESDVIAAYEVINSGA